MRYFDKDYERIEDINWNEYLNKIIDNLRLFYNSQSPQKELPQKDQDELFVNSFLPPCQVEVLDSDYEAVLLVVHDKERKDKEFYIKKIIKNFGESDFIKKYKLLLPPNFAKTEPATSPNIWIITEKDFFAIDAADSDAVAERIIGKISVRINAKFRDKQIASIEHTTASLKDYINKSEPTDKVELTEITKKIDTALQEIKRIDEHDKKILSVEKDIVGMRRLVGESKEFQEWRALTSDVQRLKDEHVARKEFDANIRRLDEKIDSVNTLSETLEKLGFGQKEQFLILHLQ